MKKFLTFTTIMILSFGMNAQTIGANAEGLTEKYQQSDLTLIDQLGDIVIAWPGGASAKYNESRLDRPGIGMQRSTINYFNSVFGKDENGVDNIENDLKDLKQDSTDDRSQLYDLQEIQESSNCKIIWKANIFVSPDIVVKSIKDFQSIGGIVNGFSLGNELYFVLDFDGDAYIEMIDGLARRLKTEFPSIPIALCFAQDVFSPSHAKFNSAVINYVNSNPGLIDAVDTHPYLSQEIDPAEAIHPCKGAGKKDINPIAYSSAFNPALSAAFDLYNQICDTTSYYQNCFDYINESMPGIKIWTSEWGSIPVLLWGNTWSNGAYMFNVFTDYSPRVQYFCAHNLLGNFHWAMIYNHQTHVQFYSLKLANQLLQNDFSDLSYVNNISAAGDYYFRFTNYSGVDYQYSFEMPDDLQIESVTKYSVNSKINYGTMGEAGFYFKKTPAPGTDCFYSESESYTIEKHDFGYVHVKVKELIRGSLDSLCMNYNPDATIIDECIPFPDPCIYGCTDPSSCNYNAKATCDDGSCKYQRKFLFFKWCPKRITQTKKIAYGS